jgi:phasin family protein
MSEQSNPFNPFANFDLGKFDLGQFDISKMLGNLQVPGFDVNVLMTTQRKNLEALNAANKKAVESMQAIAKRQAEILAQAMAEVSTSANQITSVASPQEMTAKQAELVKQAFEKALNNMRELAEMVNKANTEAFAILNQRMNESMAELQGVVAKVESAKESK